MRWPLLLAILICGCAQSWRAYPPELKQEVRVSVPAYHASKLKNGLTFIHYSSARSPQVVIQFVLRIGNAALSEKKDGLLHLWLSSLAEADDEARQAFDTLGDIPHSNVDATSAALTLEVAATDLELGLSSVARLLRKKGMAPELFERRRRFLLERLHAEQRDPYDGANLALRRSLFGSRHPLARSSIGSPQALAALTLADLEAMQQAFIGPSNLAVVVVGATSEADALAATEKAFADWQAPVEAPPRIPPIPPVLYRNVKFIPSAGFPKSVVTLASIGPEPGSADEIPFLIAIGLLESRIFHRLCGDKEVCSQTTVHRHALSVTSYFGITSYVDPDATADALSDMIGQAETLSYRGFSDYGMPYYRLYGIQQFTRRFASLSGSADFAGELYCLGFSMLYPRDVVESSFAITADQVQDVIRRYFKSEQFKFSVIGDARVAKQIQALNIGAVEFESTR